MKTIILDIIPIEEDILQSRHLELERLMNEISNKFSDLAAKQHEEYMITQTIVCVVFVLIVLLACIYFIRRKRAKKLEE